MRSAAVAEDFPMHATASDRRWQRRSFDVRVRVNTAHGGRMLVVPGRSRDLSPGGLGTVLTLALPRGTPVIITLQRRGRELDLPAVLRHRQGFRCGFQFRALTAATLRMLRRLHAQLPD